MLVRLVLLQTGLMALASVLLWFAGQAHQIFSLLYGGVLMVANNVALVRMIERAAVRRKDAGRALLYQGAAFRFVLLVLLLAAAYAMGLYLPWVAGGMLVAQVAVYVLGVNAARLMMK